MADFIPSGDAEFDAMLTLLANTVNTNAAAYGEDLGSLTALNTARSAWALAWPNYNNALAQAEGATATKVSARTDVEAELRALNRRVQARDTVTDTAKLQAGLPVHDPSNSPLPPPTSAPLLQVDTSQRLMHTISFRDAANPNRRGKPPGVFGCSLYVKIGTPPANLADATFVAVDTRSPYLFEFEPEDAGKIAYWIACWVNPRQDTGPCSETVAATITG